MPYPPRKWARLIRALKGLHPAHEEDQHTVGSVLDAEAAAKALRRESFLDSRGNGSIPEGIEDGDPRLALRPDLVSPDDDGITALGEAFELD
jgi:hypothetical protein